MGKRGAPKGGRVHWIQWNARVWMLRDYVCEAKYLSAVGVSRHCYRYTRKCRKARQDDYTIIHRNSKSWLLIYFDRPELFIYEEYFRNSAELLRRMDELNSEKERREDLYCEKIAELLELRRRKLK